MKGEEGFKFKFLWRFHRVGDYLIARNGRIIKNFKKFPHHLQERLQELHDQLKVQDDLMVHASVCEIHRCCEYPNCVDGKVLLHHVLICHVKGCRRCDVMLQLVKFHARQCPTSSCKIPRCSEMKELNLSEDRKLKSEEERKKMKRKREEERKQEREDERLIRLRLRELELKKIYDSQ